MKKLRKLRTDQKLWVHAKASLMVWAIFFFFFTPTVVESALGFVIAGSISLMVVLGTVLSITGMLRSQTTEPSKILAGIRLELCGLWIAIGGPASYMATQIFLLGGPDGYQRIALIFFGYAMCSFVAVRIGIVESYRKKMTS